MADIDELQIQIEADSSDAAQGISALVASLESLASVSDKAASGLDKLAKSLNSLKGIGNLQINADVSGITNKLTELQSAFSSFKVSTKLSERVQSIAQAVDTLNGITYTGDLSSLENAVRTLPESLERLKEIRIGKTAFENIANLKDAIEQLDTVIAPASFADAASVIGYSVETLDKLDIKSALSNILRLAPAMESLKNALTGMTSAAVQFENLTEQIQAMAGGLAMISMSNLSGVESIIEYLDKFQNMNLRPEFADMIERLGKAVGRMSNAKPNEAAADSLRLLIDTVRILTEDDIQRLSELSGLLTGLQGIKMPRNITINTPAADDSADSLDDYADAAERAGDASAESVPFITQFADAMNSLGRGALRAISVELRMLTAPIRAVGNAFSRAAKKTSEFLASVKRILLYRAIRAMLKSITQGLQEGRENLYQYSLVAGTDFARSMDKAATAFLYLKNSLAAATAPLTNYLVPVLDHIIDRVVELVNAFNEMTAALTGAATWTRAIKYPTQWQEAADDATKAAKKLKSTILGFDELNVIEPKDTGSGKNKLTADDYRKMFEEVKTNYKMTSGVSELVMPIKLAWDAEGDNTIKAVKNSFREILDLFGSIGDSLKTVWTNGTGQETLETILRITQNIVGTFGNLAKSIRKAWDENGRGTKIIQNLWSAGNNVLTVFENLWSSTKNWAAGLNFAPLLDGFGNLGDSLKRLTDPNGGLAKLATSVLDKFLLPVGKIIIEDALPGAIDLLSSSIDGLVQFLEFCEPLLSDFVELLGQIAGFTFDNLGGLSSGLAALIQAAGGNEISNDTAKRVEDAAKSFEDVPGYKGLEKYGGDFLYWLIGDKNQASAPTRLGYWLSDLFNGTGETETASASLQNQLEFIRKSNEYASRYGSSAQTNAKSAEDYSPDYGGLSFMYEGYKMPDYSEAAEETSSIPKDFQENWISGMETISEKFSAFGKDWKSGWNDIGDWTSKKWTKITDAFSTGWQGVKNFFANFGSNWKSGWKDIHDWGSSKWESIKETLGTGWDALKNKVSDWKDNWSVGMKSISDTVRDKWDSAKEKLSEGWSTFTGKLATWKEDFLNGMIAIKDSAREKWNFVKDKFAEGWSDWGGKLKGWKESWISGLATIKSEAHEKWDNVRSHLESGWKTIKDKVTDYFDAWTQGFKDLKKWYQDSTIGQKISSTWDTVKNAVKAFIPGFASGGTIDSGQLFIAREAGAELVGNIGGQTAVMNNQQIVQAVSSGVAQAVASVMSQVMAQSNNNGGEINLTVNLDGRQIASAVEKAQKSKGVSILGGVAYGT